MQASRRSLATFLAMAVVLMAEPASAAVSRRREVLSSIASSFLPTHLRHPMMRHQAGPGECLLSGEILSFG